jgi:hypothetical protein
MFFFLRQRHSINKMQQDQRDLVSCVRKYRAYDDHLKKLNNAANDVREKKKIVELEMGDILARPTFSHLHKLDISDDKSFIKISRPGQYSKGWSLSTRDLTTYLQEYFAKPGPKTAEDCAKYIIDKRRAELVSSDFSFSRILRLDDNTADES